MGGYAVSGAGILKTGRVLFGSNIKAETSNLKTNICRTCKHNRLYRDYLQRSKHIYELMKITLHISQIATLNGKVALINSWRGPVQLSGDAAETILMPVFLCSNE